jgi:hypothetical protein
MTRFKELRRIEAAIKNKDHNELLWALGYCEMRMKTSTMKHHTKHWQKWTDEVKDAMSSDK